MQRTRILSFILLFAISWVKSYSLSHLYYGVLQNRKSLPSGSFSLRGTLSLQSSPMSILESANRVIELGDWSVNIAKNLADIVMSKSAVVATEESDSKSKSLAVSSAVENMSVEFLDDVVSRTPQLTTVELAVLLTTISLSALSPFFLNIEVIEVLGPSLAALSASVGISAEYIGKIAVSNGKEFAALAIIAAAEAESMLASAERSKSALPICVGLATMASAFALVIPMFIKEMSEKFKIRVAAEVYFICPIIAILAATLAGLAKVDSQARCCKAASIGSAKSNISAGASGLLRRLKIKNEDIEPKIEKNNQEWKMTFIGVMTPVVLAGLFPGPLATKSIVCSAVAAAQSAYYLAVAEYFVSVATDAVALKARTAAVSDFYANQASRASAILPFTSALAGFCAAASAAAVELLPFVNTLEQSLVALIFPCGAALFAAAAAVSKARCEVRNDNVSFSDPYELPSHDHWT